MHKNILKIGFLLFSLQTIAQELDKVPDSLALKDSVNKLEEILIFSNNIKFSVNRSGINAMDLPQSIQVINAKIIEQQQSIRLSEVIKNVNGVYVGSARGGAQESFWSRGYYMSSQNTFKNGFRFNSGSFPEVSALERVEVLKGSSALLFGEVSPGGILNIVTKSPNFKTGGEASMQAGSYSFYKPYADFYGVINKNMAYRINGSYENSGSYRDVVNRQRYYLNPSLLLRVTNKTVITLQGDYLYDDWVPDFGTGAVNNKIITTQPRSAYLGARWSKGNTQQSSVSAIINHQLNTNWKASFNSAFQYYDKTHASTERVRIVKADGSWERPYGKGESIDNIITNQISLKGNVTTYKIKHEIFSGFDTELSYTDSYVYAFYDPSTKNKIVIYDKINIFDANSYSSIGAKPPLPSELTEINKAETMRLGAYIQDLVSLGEKLKVLLGIRYSYQVTTPQTHYISGDKVTHDYDKGITTVKKVAPANSTVVQATRNDDAFSPKIGFIYQPTKEITLFTSYANSFSPNTGIDIYKKAIKPSIIDQFEVGIKNELFGNKLTANITMYQIVNSNLVQQALYDASGNLNTDSNVKELTGQTTSNGIEIDFIYKPIQGLNILAGYSFNDMRYSKTTGGKGSYIVGDRLARTPQHTANTSFFYTIQTGILKNVSIGALVSYIGDRVGGWNNRIADPSSNPKKIEIREIPVNGYLTIDISLGYTWKKLSVLAKMANITDELNYTVHEDYSINPIAPRHFVASLKYSF